MITGSSNEASLRAENDELRARLDEAEETLRAIRSGEVDALVVGDKIYMLESAGAASNHFRGEVLAQVNDAVVALDNDNRITYFNAAAERQYGLEASAVLGCNLDEVLQFRWRHADDEAAARKALDETGVWRGSNTHTKRNGEVIHVESTVNVLRDGGGSAMGLLAVIRDVTERMRAEEALRASEERLRLTMESVTDYAILTIDAEGRIVTWNVGAKRAFGYTEEEIRGQQVEIIYTREDRAAGIPASEMKTARQEGRASDERWHVSKRGVRFYVSGVTFPLRANGLLTGYAKIARDITESKRLEEALRRAHNELEERVAKRTRELAETNTSLEAEVRERRAAEARVKSLLRQLVAVQEEERRKIARDIHDQMGQQVTALRMNIETPDALSQSDRVLIERFRRAQVLAKELDRSMDFLTWELRPTALDHLGLPAALASLVSGWSERFGIPAEFHSSGVDDLCMSHETEINLYRLVQEALHNVYKHAGAGSVGVLFERQDDLAVLIIEDDGRGFDPGKVSPGSHGERMGIVGMRERAALVGGEFEVESSPGGGTAIFVRIHIELEDGVEESSRAAFSR